MIGNVGSLIIFAAGVWSLTAPALAGSKLNAKLVTSTAELSTIRGVVKATTQATLASQVPGRISQLPFKEGQRFHKGAILVALDCAKYEAELASAAAEHRAKEKTYENNLHMEKLQAIGQLDVEVSHAEADKAAAVVQAAKVTVDNCVIHAPFTGRVTKLTANEHENIAPADSLISVIDDGQLEIELIVPSKALAWLKVKTPFKFVIDETGRHQKAVVREIGASVDSASQTIKVKGHFVGTPADVLAGMSGTAMFTDGHP